MNIRAAKLHNKQPFKRHHAPKAFLLLAVTSGARRVSVSGLRVIRPDGVAEGRVFRCVCRAGKTWGVGVTERVVWHVVKDCAKRAAIENLAPHDLRRTCARLCRDAGGELDQIQFLLGHVSIQTTEKYLGCKQRLQNAVNDRIGIEPNL